MKQLRNVYGIGREALGRQGPRVKTYGKGVTAKLAERHSISESDVFAARQFADRYSEEELDELIDTCQSAGFPLGKSHVAKLITVKDKRERKRLQRECIQESWTAKTLQANLRGMYGKRSPGGGKVRPPKSVDDAERKIAHLCKKLLDLHEAMKSADPDSDEECGVSDLPEELRKQLARTMTQVNKLAAVCDSGE